MSDHGSAPSGGSEGSSRVQPSSIINEGKSAKRKIEGSIFKYALFFLALLMIWNIKACYKTHKQEVEAKKAEAAEYAATHPTPTTPTVEALVLTESCTTPCSAYVGWKYKVRTDGDPFQVKYEGCKNWAERSGKGNFKAPECFQPGIAQFESGDKGNPTILIQIYKKVNI